MDKLGKQLKEDARNIESTVSPALRARIAASLASTDRRAAKRAEASRSRNFNRASGLAGIAAAAAVIVVLNWPLVGPDPAPIPATPGYATELSNPIPLQFGQVELTDPLQEELTHLRADVEKMRKAVERDLGVTF